MKNQSNYPFSFIGRKTELDTLRQNNWRSKAELIVVYGRRRVGKTALIEYAYSDQLLWKFEGIEGLSKKNQIKHFLNTLNNYTSKSNNHSNFEKISTWNEALIALANATQDKKIILFFDEFQWMANENSELVSVLKLIWDNKLSSRQNIKLILCGSIASFMVKKVLRSKALYGRVNTEINLQPLKIQEIELFFSNTRSRTEVLDIAMICGGIPQYLVELNPRMSVLQNLQEKFFSPNGWFVHELGRLFTSHFGKNPLFSEIVRTLSTKNFSAEELAKKIKTKSGGTFTGLLQELAWAGFIEKTVPIQKEERNSKLVHWKIADEYLHFYFKFIEPRRKEIEQGNVQFSKLEINREYLQWRGYAFERLCQKNSLKIAERLKFSGITFRSGSWFQSDRAEGGKAQIDLVFARADRTLTVCEIKLSFPKDLQSEQAKLITRAEHLRKNYPNKHSIETVLILLKTPSPKEKEIALRYFSHVLWAEELFF